MKCPDCGQWNRASMPHCIKCGAPLNIDEAVRLQWKDKLKDGGPSTSYLRADEFGQVDTSPDARDELAGEMQDLKKRKREGAERQRRLSRDTASRPASDVVITEEPAARPHRSRHDDVPATAVRVQPASQGERTRKQESEMRHRVRYMNENSVFAESRTYDPVQPDGYSQGTGSWHLAGPLSHTLAPKKENRHILLKVLLALVLIVALGAGGFFAWHYFTDGSEPSVNQDAVVTASLMDDLPAHLIMIPGEEGTTIYVRELHASYPVLDGFATIEVADHIWYDNLEGALDETMNVTLTPLSAVTTFSTSPYFFTISLSDTDTR